MYDYQLARRQRDVLVDLYFALKRFRSEMAAATTDRPVAVQEAWAAVNEAYHAASNLIEAAKNTKEECCDGKRLR